MPDGGFFPQPASRRRKAEPPILQNPERGVVEIKPADYNLDTLTNEPQTLRYLKQYGLVLITNLRDSAAPPANVSRHDPDSRMLHARRNRPLRSGTTHSRASPATPISFQTSSPASCSIARRSSSRKM